jgi:hypothetical protein
MSAFGRLLSTEAFRRTSALGECEKLRFLLRNGPKLAHRLASQLPSFQYEINEFIAYLPENGLVRWARLPDLYRGNKNGPWVGFSPKNWWGGEKFPRPIPYK